MTIDDLTVIGIDGIRRSFAEHYDTMMEVEQDPTGAHHAIQNQHDRIEELEAKNDNLMDLSYGEHKRAMAAEAKLAESEALLAKAVDALEFIDGKISWEINPSNYDHDQVCDMNADWCVIGNYVEAILAELKGENHDL